MYSCSQFGFGILAIWLLAFSPFGMIADKLAHIHAICIDWQVGLIFDTLSNFRNVL
jgi:hypothetical protein